MLAGPHGCLPGTVTDLDDPFRPPDPVETQVVLSRESKSPTTNRRRLRSLKPLPIPKHTPWHAAEPLNIDPREATFRHSHWERHRESVARILFTKAPDSSAYYRFYHCGANPVLYREIDTGEWMVRSCTCKHRMCQPCRRRTAALVQSNLERHCLDKIAKNDNRSLRAITLTLKHARTPLKNQIRRLFKCFAALRRRKSVKDLFFGGSFILEIKVSTNDKKWHPHLHIIAEGRFVHIEALSAAWEAVTKDSFRCYIKRIENVAEAVGHDTKYITKATDNSVFECQHKLREYIEATKGVRAYGTFGSWRGLNLTERTRNDGNWIACGLLRHWILRAESGDPHSKAVVDYLKRRPACRGTDEEPDSS